MVAQVLVSGLAQMRVAAHHEAGSTITGVTVAPVQYSVRQVLASSARYSISKSHFRARGVKKATTILWMPLSPHNPAGCNLLTLLQLGPMQLDLLR